MGQGRADEVRDMVNRATTLTETIGNDLRGFGGFLRCETCGNHQPLGSTAEKVARGWPKCCSLTMRWWTQRQIDAGEVSEVSWRPDRGFPSA